MRDNTTAIQHGSKAAWTDKAFASIAAMANDWIDAVAPCPWQASAGSTSLHTTHRTPDAQSSDRNRRAAPAPLYTPEERRRRDSTIWTPVQAVLAPLQFLVFLVSLGLILRYLATGADYGIAAGSVVVKTLVLYLIMITGSIWEKEVFGKWLFAPSFFWEDVFSMLVLALHTAYLAAIFLHLGDAQSTMALALAAYASYVINAGQFIWKLRMARLEGAQGSRAPSRSSGEGHAA